MAELRRRLTHLQPTRPLAAFLALGPLALVAGCSGLPFQDQFKNNSGQPPEQKIELLPAPQTGLRPLTSCTTKAPDAPAQQPAAKPFEFGGLLGAGMRQVAAGEPQAAPPPPWMQQAMTSQSQAHRPQAQSGGLLSAIFPDEKRKTAATAGISLLA
jgi:hypothetical protein